MSPKVAYPEQHGVQFSVLLVIILKVAPVEIKMSYTRVSE
jgi:hypothetical protein